MRVARREFSVGDELREWRTDPGVRRFLWHNAANLFAVGVAVSLLVPVFVAWGDVYRETGSTLILCRYVYQAPGWLIGLLMALIAILGAWVVFVTFAGWQWAPFALVVLLVLSYWGLGWTMDDDVFHCHTAAVMGIVVSQIGLILLMAPSNWVIAAAGLVPMVLITVFGQIREQIVNPLPEAVFSGGCWLTSLMIPLAFLDLDQRQYPLDYGVVMNRSAPVLLALLAIAVIVVGLSIAAGPDETAVPGSQHNVLL